MTMTLTPEQLDRYGAWIVERMRGGPPEMRNGLRFLENIVMRADMHNDSITTICGPRSSGKSNIALTCSLALHHLGVRFDWANLLHGNEPIEEVVPKITSTRRKVFDFDEGIRIANRKRSMSSAVTLFEEVLTQVRKKNHAYFIAIPKFKMLTAMCRNELVHFWVEVLDRSKNEQHERSWVRAAICTRDENPLLDDPWGIYYAEQILRKRRTKVSSLDEKERMMKKYLHSYTLTVQFPRLPKVVENAYEELAQTAVTDFGERMARKLKLPIQATPPSLKESPL